MPTLHSLFKELSPEDALLIERDFHNFEIYMMMYKSAIKEVTTKLEILSDNLSVQEGRNPIEMIKSRVKKPKSIVEKLQRKGYDMSIDSVLNKLNDVAGVRVICSFIKDIYDVADMLCSQDDITVLDVKDYIKNPKPNGYRSYHLIIEIPVFFADKKRPMRVEVQFRTIAMDFWASLEHQMKYKKDLKDNEKIIEELKSCADIIASTDEKMEKINIAISKIQNKKSV